MNKRGVFTFGVVVGICGFCVVNSLMHFGNVINREGTVKERRYWGIIAEDNTGRKWAFHTKKGFSVGDKVRIKFDCNNTLENYTDDKLLKITLDK